MNKREEYTNCMKPYMTGGGPDRKIRFCIGAKICSKKTNNEQEAAKLCAEAALNPKPPRVKRGAKCVITPSTITCIIKNLGGSEVTPANLMGAVTLCTGQKPLTREGFIKKCFKENAITGDMKEAQKLRSMCTDLWKEQEISNEAR